MMKRASYRYGVSWIAVNDEAEDTDVESIAAYVTTLMLADLFNKNPDDVAKDILRARQKQLKG